jgi:hypothetical protein
MKMTKNFYFHTKHDPIEAIGKCNTFSLEEAIAIFAERKQLSIDSFLQIYDVKENENRNNSTSRDTKSS